MLVNGSQWGKVNAVQQCHHQELRGHTEWSEILQGSLSLKCKVLPPAIGISLNGHNISSAQKAVLDGHRYDNPLSELNMLKKSPFWTLEHDNIAKFGTEYSGILLRGIEADLQPLHVRFAL